MGEMIGKGKILKIRLGHEANCSSGMIAMFILMAAAVTHLPLAIVTAIIHVTRLKKDAEKKWRILYWLVPQILGLGFTAFLIRLSLDEFYGYSRYLTVFAAAIGASFALATTATYLPASRIRRAWLVVPMAPLVFVLGVALSIVLPW